LLPRRIDDRERTVPIAPEDGAAQFAGDVSICRRRLVERLWR